MHQKLLQAAATGEEDGKVPGLLGKFRALDCGMHQLPRFPVPADAVLAQPHYRDGAGQLPWTHLRFWCVESHSLGGIHSPAVVTIVSKNTCTCIFHRAESVRRTQKTNSTHAPCSMRRVLGYKSSLISKTFECDAKPTRPVCKAGGHRLLGDGMC